MTAPFYVTTAIPYVNGAPHVGHALELVQADALARHARRRGRPTRSLTGTDDNAVKNAQSARDAGVAVAAFVDANARRFAALRAPLALSNDDFIRTSADPRHRPTVEWLWDACRATGDLYHGRYEGWYCDGCEEFSDQPGRCDEHGARRRVVEDNWFFRLSRHRRAILDAIEGGTLRIEPAHRRNEVLAFVRAGLRDISVSRDAARSGGWGIRVPGDDGQVIYVWFDALANYVSALDAPGGAAYAHWWCNGGERVHVIGKGIVRFHAVLWPAILRSAGQPLPTTIFVHDYLTVDGEKIGKSAGNAIDPATLASRHGTDALRWWLLHEGPRTGDADFTEDRLVAAADRDLANGVGNFVQRVRGLARHAHDDTTAPHSVTHAAAAGLDALVAAAPDGVDDALARFDFRGALDALLAIVAEGNRYIETVRPWEHDERDGRDGRGGRGGRGDVLRPLCAAVDSLAGELEPFVPGVAARIANGEPVFGRLNTRPAAIRERTYRRASPRSSRRAASR